MNQRLLHFSITLCLLGFIPQVSAQETSSFDAQFAQIDNELVKWDPVRGKWLGSSLKAMSVNEPIPDRTFPEDFSPAEMLTLVPQLTVESIRSISQTNSQSSRDLLARERWARINTYANRPTCSLVMGRTYGDPHLKSFDGAVYSFQTVGEFVLATANNGQFEVQVRQQPESDNISLNTAVAMRVGGDRLGIYARDKRDAFNAPVMLNGMPIEVGANSYYLPHGGTISHSGKNYLVTWPTGEKVSVDLSQTGNMRFMNVGVQVYPCISNNYSGLMGNANGNQRDDFNVSAGGSSMTMFGNSTVSDQMEKERLAFLAKDFADHFRITPQNSLFDYGFGESTMAFTDYSYPRVHRTINDMPTNQRNIARNNCIASGLTGDDLNACIYDNGFLNIAPVQPPVIPNRTNNVTLGRVETEVPNVNPTRVPNPSPAVIHDGQHFTRPVDTRPNVNEEIKPREVPNASPKPKWESIEVENRTNDNNGATPKPSMNNTNGNGHTASPVKPSKTEPSTQPVQKPKPSNVPPREAPTPGKVEKPAVPATPKPVKTSPQPAPVKPPSKPPVTPVKRG
ncbi:MAG: VWD domain-containing protein [Crocinitomicaceae bacterium]